MANTDTETAAQWKLAGDYVRGLREAAGLTQLDVSSSVGFQYYTTVSQVERGKTRLPPEKMRAWAKALRADERAFAKRLLMYYDPHFWTLICGKPTGT